MEQSKLTKARYFVSIHPFDSVSVDRIPERNRDKV